MENRKITTRNYNNLLGRIAEILKSARSKLVREINKTLTDNDKINMSAFVRLKVI